MTPEKLRELAQDFLRKNPKASASLVEAYLLTLPGEKATEDEAHRAVQSMIEPERKWFMHLYEVASRSFLQEHPDPTAEELRAFFLAQPGTHDRRELERTIKRIQYGCDVRAGRIKKPDPPAPPVAKPTIAVSTAVMAAIKKPAPKPVRLRREPIDPRFIPEEFSHWRPCGPWYRVYGVEGIAVNPYGTALRYGPVGVKRISLGPIAPVFDKKGRAFYRVWVSGKRRDLALNIIMKSLPRAANVYAGSDGIDLENASNDAGSND